MNLQLDRATADCFRTISLESPQRLVARLLNEKKLRSPNSVSDSAKTFFKGYPGDYRLFHLDTGEDSEIHIYHEANGGECGLVKLFNTEICTIAQIQRYRQWTQNAIDEIATINDAIDATMDIQGDIFHTEARVIPVAEPIERNDVAAVFIDDENWIMGSDIYGSRKRLRPNLYGALVARDVTPPKSDEAYYTIPYINFHERIRFCENVLTPIVQETIGAIGFTICCTNVKAEIDRERKKFTFVITDLADLISNMKPAKEREISNQLTPASVGASSRR